MSPNSLCCVAQNFNAVCLPALVGFPVPHIKTRSSDQKAAYYRPKIRHLRKKHQPPKGRKRKPCIRKWRQHGRFALREGADQGQLTSRSDQGDDSHQGRTAKIRRLPLEGHGEAQKNSPDQAGVEKGGPDILIGTDTPRQQRIARIAYGLGSGCAPPAQDEA